MNPGVRSMLFVIAGGEVSGAEVVALRAVSLATSSGILVSVACPSGPLVDRLPPLVRHVSIPLQAFTSDSKVRAAPGFASRVNKAAKILRREAATVDRVVVNSFFALPCVMAARCQAPVTWLVHDVIWRNDWFAVMRAAKGSIDDTIAVSEAVATPLRQRGWSVRVVYNGVPWPVELRGAEPEPPVIGCAALITPWKGHEILLEAFAGLTDTDVTLELAGGTFDRDRDYAHQLYRRAQQPDLAGRVRFLGHVDTLRTMRGWTMAVSSSVDPEAHPLVVLEAMSVGVPVIATGLGGPLEILGRGGGFLVPPRSPEFLQRAMSTLLADASARARMSAWGPREVARYYQLDVQNQILLSALFGQAA